jgi:hypothetical protein
MGDEEIYIDNLIRRNEYRKAFWIINIERLYGE